MAIKSPETFTATGVKAWIAKTCAELGTTPTQLAKRAGIAPSTLNKFIADSDETRNLTARTISKLTDAAKEIEAARNSRYPSPNSIGATDDVEPDLIAAPLLDIPVVSARIDAKQLELDQLYAVKVPIPENYQGGILLGIELGSTIAQPIFRPGSLLIVDGERTGMRKGAITGERVVVGEDVGEKYLRITVREMLAGPSGDHWLVGLPVGKSQLRDIYLGRDIAEFPEDLFFIGRVIMSLQPEPSVYGGFPRHAP